MIYICRCKLKNGLERTEVLTDLDLMPCDVVEYTVVNEFKN
jgi:hypothetical protein